MTSTEVQRIFFDAGWRQYRANTVTIFVITGYTHPPLLHAGKVSDNY